MVVAEEERLDCHRLSRTKEAMATLAFETSKATKELGSSSLAKPGPAGIKRRDVHFSKAGGQF